MNVSSWAGLLDAAPWLVPVAGASFVMFLVAAFKQGRAISLWSVRVGPQRQRADRPDSVSSTTGKRRDVRVYGVEHAKDFYQIITPNYDQRNSGMLIRTHLATVAEIQKLRAQHDRLRVLDLGGGTGKLIALQFFNDPGMEWTYVDFCPAMAAEFRRRLSGYPLGDSAQAVVEDINRAIRQLPPASFDVIVISLVLSSMPALPDFRVLAKLLAPGGSLLVADINPGYTRDNPLYEVAVAGGVVALRTTPVDPFEVARRATVAGLRTTQQKPLPEDGSTYYSFLVAFSPVPAPQPEPALDRGLSVTQ